MSVVSPLKCTWKLAKACWAAGISFHLLMALWKMPVFLNIMSARHVAVASVMASLPATEKIVWQLQMHFHKSSTDSSSAQGTVTFAAGIKVHGLDGSIGVDKGCQ